MSQAPVTVRRVSNRKEWRALIEFPWAVYKDDANWVPSLMSQRKFAFDQKKNPTWEYLDGEFFVAWRGKRPVGTVVAAVNHRHNEFYDERIGFFGHFEVFEDAEAAGALLGTATDWVRDRGMEAIRGPLSMTINDEVGCLIDGFDAPPMLIMAHNPPYYGGMIEAAGFSKVMDMFAWYADAQMVLTSEGYEKMSRIMGKLRQRRNITIRPGDMRRLEAEIRRIQELYQAGWAENWGFVPPTEREIDHLVEELTRIYDPRLGYFAERDGEPLGFILVVPNFNQVLLRAYPRPGVPEWFTLLKALWHWKIRPKIDSIRVMLLGVRKEYRNQGIDGMLINAVIEAGVAAGYKWCEGGWVLEVNTPMNLAMESLGCDKYKTYRVYQKPV